MRKTMAQLKQERASIKREIVEMTTELCEHWAARSLTASSSSEAMDMLFLWFAYAFGGRLIKHNELSADTLTELVACEIVRRDKLTEDERYRQCEAITSVWRSWIFMARYSWSEGDAQGYWFFRTRKVHPSSRGASIPESSQERA